MVTMSPVLQHCLNFISSVYKSSTCYINACKMPGTMLGVWNGSLRSLRYASMQAGGRAQFTNVDTSDGNFEDTVGFSVAGLV